MRMCALTLAFSLFACACVPVAETGGVGVAAGQGRQTVIEQVPLTNLADVVGTYEVSGNDPDGSTYAGQCTLTLSPDGSIAIEWRIGTRAWKGTGKIAEDGNLQVTYAGAFGGAAAYGLYSDGTIRGTWRGQRTNNLGREVLRRIK